jgi:arylsulfatase A-like enzyme
MVLSHARGGGVDYTEWTTEYAVSRTESDSAMAIRGNRWKYIEGTDGVELYDLSKDPGETTDRSEEESDVVSEFERRREEYLDSLPAPSTTGSIESEGMRDHLRSLGYLQE